MYRQWDIETTVRKNQWFLFSEEGSGCLAGKEVGVWGGGVAADASNMLYNMQILHQHSNYFAIYECKNVMDVIGLQQ